MGPLQILEWLESQLEVATEQGGNFIAPGVHVDEVDAMDNDELKVWLTNGQQFIIKIKEL